MIEVLNFFSKFAQIIYDKNLLIIILIKWYDHGAFICVNVLYLIMCYWDKFWYKILISHALLFNFIIITGNAKIHEKYVHIVLEVTYYVLGGDRTIEMV